MRAEIAIGMRLKASNGMVAILRACVVGVAVSSQNHQARNFDQQDNVPGEVVVTRSALTRTLSVRFRPGQVTNDWASWGNGNPADSDSATDRFDSDRGLFGKTRRRSVAV